MEVLSEPRGDRYRRIRQLGEGGAGRVWLIEDELRPGSRLALKELAEHPFARVSDAGLALFERIRPPYWLDGKAKPTHLFTPGRLEWAILILQRSGREVTGKDVVALISE